VTVQPGIIPLPRVLAEEGRGGGLFCRDDACVVLFIQRIRVT